MPSSSSLSFEYFKIYLPLKITFSESNQRTKASIEAKKKSKINNTVIRLDRWSNRWCIQLYFRVHLNID